MLIVSYALVCGRVVRWSWVNIQGRGVLLIWMIVGQGPVALAIGADGGCLDIFTLLYLLNSIPPSLWETTRYRLKYCLKGPLNPKQQSTNHPYALHCVDAYCFVFYLVTLLDKSVSVKQIC